MTPSPTDESLPWIALSIGNSRLHWFYFQGGDLEKAWDTPHTSSIDLQNEVTSWQTWQRRSPALAYHSDAQTLPELWIASVVPTQTLFWQAYVRSRILTCEDIPIQSPYPTFGLDRAVAIWAAGTLYQWPILVIDAGTALTYTGAIAPDQCVGGAILPGLGLQLRSLSQFTVALPPTSSPDSLPPRWAQETSTAMQSGILHTLLSGIIDFIHAWLAEHPTSNIVLTGGDAAILHPLLHLKAQPQHPSAAVMEQIILDPLLQGRGIQHLRAGIKNLM